MPPMAACISLWIDINLQLQGFSCRSSDQFVGPLLQSDTKVSLC